MPAFELNTARSVEHPFFGLSTFARGYVEAMFFTNGDTGEEDESLLNNLGVEKLTHAAVATIQRDCEAFQQGQEARLYRLYNTHDYGDDQAGRDFWFTRQGHGVGFSDRDLPSTDAEALEEAARGFRESCVEVSRRRIHVR